MSNSNNPTHSTSKLNNNNTQELITTEPEESSNQTCDDNKTKTCTNKNNTNSNLTNIITYDETTTYQYHMTTWKPQCDLDFTVCNNSTNNTEVLKTACENYTCIYNKVGEDEMEDSGVCVAHKCLQLEYTECADCLCQRKDADITAQKHLTEFNDILKRVDCKRPYSLWNCTHCLAVYKHWICATQGLYQEDESKPCLAMCTSVMSNCPYLVPHKLYGGSPSFQCPKFSDLTLNHTYASQKGKCFTCNNTQANTSTPCLLSTQATNHSHRFTSKFGLLVWLVFLMRIFVYFNTESYL
ncbi:uncharacterized protein [Antedon mediterranea]